MNDPILNERLSALERNLGHVKDPTSWGDRFKQLRISDHLWIDLDGTIGCAARDLIERTKEIRSENSITAAWTKYRKVADDSQPLFRESLELLEGLAFRAQLLDESICQIADQLIHQCSSITRNSPSLTVPAAQEALARTMGRFIRMRFPEWTVWTLPLIAREYGHVVFSENPTLTSALAEQMPEVGETRVLELVTDAFATYIMGPAYACASIMLRLDPTMAYIGSDKHPDEGSRARIILRMLRRMNEEAPLGRRPYTEIHSQLEKNWETMVRQTAVTGSSAFPDDFLDRLIDLTWSRLNSRLPVVARYPIARNDGWLVACDCSTKWNAALADDDGSELTVGEISASSKLRDALNAAWICRIEYPEKVKQIEKGAIEFCKRIVAMLKPEDRPGPSENPPGGPTATTKK